MPRRAPVACGALGSHGDEVLRRLVAAMPAPVAVRHRDATSALYLDREPNAWRAGRTRGLAWSQAQPSGQPIRSWQDAAVTDGANGLVIKGRRRFVHTSVSGVAPLYAAKHGGAVYFASTIDPLAAALPGPLTADWAAWSSIFCLRYAVGARTPFAEIKRIGPHSVLEPGAPLRRLAGEDWPWAGITPRLGLAEGTDSVAAAIRASLERISHEQLACLLSGGWDSRVLLYGLRAIEAGDVRAITVVDHTRTDREETFARQVARATGVEHELLRGNEEDYWEQARERAHRCDYQLPATPWQMPAAERLRGSERLVLDGLAFDVFAFTGRHFFTAGMVHPDGTDRVAAELWDQLTGQRLRRARPALIDGALARGLERRSRRAFMKATEPYRGHPAEPVLLHYLTRTLRGMSLTLTASLGLDATVVAPFCDDAVARACLAIRPEAKFGYRLQPEVMRVLAPDIPSLPSTNDTDPPPGRPLRPRQLSSSALEGYREVLRRGPLYSYLGPRLRESVSNGGLDAMVARQWRAHVVDAVALFHLWCDRYGSRVSGTDPAEALGIEPGQAADDRETYEEVASAV
jgi:hypothetical protein